MALLENSDNFIAVPRVRIVSSLCVLLRLLGFINVVCLVLILKYHCHLNANL